MTVPVVTLFSGILCVTFLWWVAVTQVQHYQDDATTSAGASPEDVTLSAAENNGGHGFDRQSTNNGWRVTAESVAFANATGSSRDDLGNGNLCLGDEITFMGISYQRWISATVLAIIVGVRGASKGHLSLSGLVAGIALAIVSVLANFATAGAGTAFYVTSSAATNFRAARKRKIDASYKEGGQRNWVQAIACGGVAAEMCLIQLAMVGAGEMPVDFESDYLHSYLSMAALGSVACSNGDTWASELGTVFETTQPRLITNLRRVPKGTNGAVTAGGLLVSFLGGLIVGIAYYMTLTMALSLTGAHGSHKPQWPIVMISAAAGLFGSLLDSLLGATCQFTGIDETTGLIVDDEHRGRKQRKSRGAGSNSSVVRKSDEVPPTNACDATVKKISGIPLLSNCGVNLVSCLISAFFAAELARLSWPE